ADSAHGQALALLDPVIFRVADNAEADIDLEIAGIEGKRTGAVAALFHAGPDRVGIAAQGADAAHAGYDDATPTHYQLFAATSFLTMSVMSPTVLSDSQASAVFRSISISCWSSISITISVRTSESISSSASSVFRVISPVSISPADAIK